MVENVRIDSLVAAERYDAAILELEKALRASPGSVPVRQRLADVLLRSGRRDEAAGLLVGLAEEFATDGFTAKAIATIKKVQRVDRRRPEMAGRLAELIMLHNLETGITPDGRSERARTEVLGSLPSLRHSPLSTELSAEELVVLIHRLELESYGPEQEVFAESDEGEGLYIVAGGSARVLKRGADGGNREVGRLGYGDFFGESALLGTAARTVTVKAKRTLEVLMLSRGTFDSLAATHPRIAETLRRFAEQRARSPQEHTGGDRPAGDTPVAPRG